MKPQLPEAAQSKFGRMSGLSWDSAHELKSTIKGLLYGSFVLFAAPPAVLYVSKLDIDSDGPGGSRAQDRWWQKDTSLRTSGGTSLDSRKFPGVVVNKRLHDSGVKLGDIGICFWRGVAVAVQAYDTGPVNKVGEASLYTARKLAVIPANVSDHAAATHGNNVSDVLTLFYPGSGPGHSLPLDVIHDTAKRLLGKSGLVGVL